MRKIIHIDMDAFYASVEQRDNADLRGKPVAVGGGKRGVVAAASYEARRFGVRSAMPSATAARKCAELIFVPPRFDVYRAISHQIRAIFADYTDLIEPLSLDEAYLDVTHDHAGIGSASQIARTIRARIQADTGLTASAGVSYNKFIAKLASDQNKPDGLCIIRPDEGAAFVAKLPVRRFHGIGPRLAEKLAKQGIETGADLRALAMEALKRDYGNQAQWLYLLARGIDNRPVDPVRDGTSVGAERTYSEDISGPDIAAAVERIADILWQRIEANDVQGRTLTLKLKRPDFSQITRSKSQATAFNSRAMIGAAGQALLSEAGLSDGSVRLVGLTISGMLDEAEVAQGVLGL